MKRAIIFLFLLQAFTLTAREAAQPKPLSFIENKGQIVDQHGKHRSDIDFKAEADGMVMFVGDAQLHYQWYRTDSKFKIQNSKGDDIPLTPFKGGMPGFPFEGNNAKSPSGDLGVHSPFEGGVRPSRTGDVDSWMEVYRMDVELIGANKNAELVTEDKQEYTENYYLPQCPDGATAHSYSRVIYKNVYPNIDWVIYTNSKVKSQKSKEGTIIDHKSSISNELKYDFIVHPGGDYRNIQVRYNGATKIELKDGTLIATTPFGCISENAPYTYDAETKKEITSKFVLNGNILSYNIDNNTSLSFGEGRGEVIIDPSLGWATYYGGSDHELEIIGRNSADTAGNVYMTGCTYSTTNIATAGAYQSSYGGSLNGFLVKFNIAGQRQWATYYGGNNTDKISGVAADPAGNVYIAGAAGSAGLASTGAYQTTLGGNSDGILVKFNTNGLRLWATYYGGNGGDAFDALVYDKVNDCIFAGGQTATATGLATTGAYLGSLPSIYVNGIVVKFSASGSRLWATYYYSEIIDDLATDLAGNLYICGSTKSSTGISTTGAFRTSYTSANISHDNFICKFNASGSYQWGTYYGSGTTSAEFVNTVIADRLGNIYVAGSTPSATIMSTAGSYQQTYGGGNSDGYLAKFSSTGSRQWATYYGGSGDEIIGALALSDKGDILLCGGTTSSSGIAGPGAYQSSFGGFIDMFMTIFNPAGQREYATYYGGTGYEMYGTTSSFYSARHPAGISYGKGRIYMGGRTLNSPGLATTGAYQTSNNGGWDGLLVQFDADTAVYIAQPFADTFKCVGDSLHVAYGVTQNFRSTNTFTLQLSNASGSFASPTTLATVSGGAPGTFHCIVPNVTNGTGYRLRVLGSAPADTSDDNGLNIRIQSYPTTPVASANTPLCSGNTLNISSTNSTTGVVWSWAGPGSYTANTQNTSITNAQTTHSGDYIVTANLNGCVRKDTVTVTVNQTPAKPTVGSNTPLCSGNTLSLTASSTTPGVSWIWVGPNSWGSNQQNPSISNISTNGTGYYVATAILGSCSSKDSTQVTVNPGPTINVYANPNDSVCAGSSITLVALVTNGGTGPSYQWYKNSSIISGATNSSYNTIPTNGDVYYCKFTPGAGTGCNGAINSTSIPITVLPYTTPSISITAAPDTNIWQGLMVNFTATVSNCNNPAYQWKLNGNDVSGATSSTWGAATLADNNLVSCVLTCNDFCPNPKNPESNKLRMHVSTGINNTTNALSTVNIYPNPMHDELHIEGISKGTRIQLYDVLGREVYKTVTAESTHIISTASLHTGTYILQLTDASGNRGSYKVVRE